MNAVDYTITARAKRARLAAGQAARLVFGLGGIEITSRDGSWYKLDYSLASGACDVIGFPRAGEQLTLDL